MNNTVITSISALIFLVIGLLVGKSNNQIEIQTVVKTNIVERPIVKYVDKYITNIVEKDFSDVQKQKIFIASLIENAKTMNKNKIPTGVDSIRLNIFISPLLENVISEKEISNKFELDLRRVGVDVNENGKTMLTVYLDGFYTDDNNSMVIEHKFNLVSTGYYFINNECYISTIPIWKNESYGIVGKNKTGPAFNSIVEKSSIELCDMIFKSRK